MFIFVTYALLMYRALQQKFSLIIFQQTYANYTTYGNLTKIFSSEKFIETNNIFAMRGKKPLIFQLRAHNRCDKAYAIK